MNALLWSSFAFIAFTYFGYPVVLWLLFHGGYRDAFSRRRVILEATETRPSVTVVIAAFNEEDCIGETVSSILEADYPANALEILVVSDASTDRTDDIVSTFKNPRVRLLRQPERAGQTRGLLRGAREATGSIVVLADASGRFLAQTLRHLIRHFSDPSVGAVSGYNSIQNTGTTVAKGDSLYARYDRTLRFWESRTGSSWVGCQGGIFAIRKPLFRVGFPLDMAADNATCYELFEHGYCHRYDPEAMVIERPPDDLENEFRRKIRIIVLQLHGMWHFRRLFRPLKNSAFFFQNFCHKICRWLVPLALIVLAISSLFNRTPTGRLFVALQALFYVFAFIGMIYPKYKKAPKIISVPAYFLTVNVAGLLAWGMLLHDYTVWTPPSREAQTRF